MNLFMTDLRPLPGMALSSAFDLRESLCARQGQICGEDRHRRGWY